MFTNKLRVVFFFLLTASMFFFGEAGFERALGWGIRWAVQMQMDGELEFRNLEWKKGKLVFHDVIFHGAQSIFCVETPRLEAVFSFHRRSPLLHVLFQVEKPRLTIYSDIPSSSFSTSFEMNRLPKSSGWIDWRGKWTDGMLYWPALALEARMRFEKTAPRQLGHVVLEKGSSSLQIEAFQEDRGVRFETLLSHCDAPFLQSWLKLLRSDAQWEKGIVDGWAHVELFEGEAMYGSAHLDVEDAVLQVQELNVCLGKASLDWDGPLQKGCAEPASRLRCQCVKSSWGVQSCGFQEIEGQLSYYSDLGIKWEARALGRIKEEFSQISLSSKGFWSNRSEPWFAMECLFSQGLCSLAGDFTDWTMQVEDLQPFWGKFAQELLLEDPLGFLSSRKEFLQVFDLDLLRQWEWSSGGVSSLFHWNSERFRFERFEAKNILISQEERKEISLGCSELTVHFAPDSEQGHFSLEGFHCSSQSSSGDLISVFDWRSFGDICEGRLQTSQWEGQVHLAFPQSFYPEPMTFASSFTLSGAEQWSISGHCNQYPFSVRASVEQSIWSLTVEGGKHVFPHGISLEQIGGHLTLRPQDWALDCAEAELKIGDQTLQLQAVECMKREDGVFFDIRLKQGFLDIARFAGREKEGMIAFDLQRTEILGELIQMEPWSWKEPSSIAASWHLPWTHMLALEPLCEAMGLSIPSSLKSSMSGEVLFDFCYLKDKLSRLTLKSSSLYLQEEPFLWTLGLQKTHDGWGLHVENEDPKHRGALDCLLSYEGNVLMLKEGRVDFPGQMSSLFHGQCDGKGRGQLLFSQCQASSYFSDFLSSLPFHGKIEGKGCLSFDVSSLFYEVDADIYQMRLESGPFYMKSKKPVHAFFSPSEGLMLQGIDGQISLEHQCLGECQINLLHWEPSRSSWLLAQTHVHCLEEAGAILLEKGYITKDLAAWNPHHEIDIIADIECASDLSTFSCFMKEGFLPCSGQLRHVQNVFFQLNDQKISCDFLYVHQNHDLKIAVQARRGPFLSGYLNIEEQAEALAIDSALTIGWQYFFDEGLSIQSIQGSLGGVEASFYLQEVDAYSHLIGSAKLNFGKLASFLPPSVAEVFTELEMGKGYELKGKLQIDRQDPSRVFFQGMLGGKQIELFGFVFRSCLAQVDIKPDHIEIGNLKISDCAGLFTLDCLAMKTEGGSPWTFMIPQILISEFRPTLLQTKEGTAGEISPLVIRTMLIRDMQGVLEDRSTYTAQGELHFINSYKRERTIFDIPSEVLGRIIGLDIELLVPVCGTLHYALKDGAFRITSLEEAYSEGGRSQFFLVQSAQSPGVDLDGNVQIQVKMKQYVLFKLTEAFTISIDGTLKHPQYHLQKNRR